MATARLTVTELFPTPPLPEAMAMTRAVSGMSVAGAGILGQLPGPGHDQLALFGVHHPGGDRDGPHAGEHPDVGLHVTLDLRAQWAPGHGEGHLDVDNAAVIGAHIGHHAQLDDVRPQLGVDHPPQGGEDLVAGGDRVLLPPDVVVPGSVRPAHSINSTGTDRPVTPWDVLHPGGRGYACA